MVLWTIKKTLGDMGEEESVPVMNVQKIIPYQKGPLSLARDNADLKGLFSYFETSINCYDRKVNKQLQTNIINAILKYYEIAYLS